MKQRYKLMLSVIFIVVATACERRSLYDDCNSDILIPVKIDWSMSGITPDPQSETDYVHRVSLRFFPKNGSAPFERYLEGDIFEGKIYVPAGSYSVVVYNEAFDDVYWNETIRFENENDYNLFSANIVEISPLPYDFYTPQQGEVFAGAVLKLASWSLDNFEVTQTKKECGDCLSGTNDGLTKVKLHCLSIPTHIVAEVTELKSAMRIEAALSGIASKVYMASGQTEISPATHLFAFQAPIWNDETKTDGFVERRLLTFGRLSQPSTYLLNLGVILVTGERHVPDTPMLYNVTPQVGLPKPNNDIELRVKLTLPKVSGDINIGGWDDEEHNIY